MKRVIAVAAGSLLIAAFLVPVAQAAPPKPTTVAGKLIDTTCKLTDLACMQKGAKLGHPLAVRAKDGKAYVITGAFAANKNAKLLALVGRDVQATGQVTLAGSKRTIAATAVVGK